MRSRPALVFLCILLLLFASDECGLLRQFRQSDVQLPEWMRYPWRNHLKADVRHLRRHRNQWLS
jgi:hypothetical protein